MFWVQNEESTLRGNMFNMQIILQQKKKSPNLFLAVLVFIFNPWSAFAQKVGGVNQAGVARPSGFQGGPMSILNPQPRMIGLEIRSHFQNDRYNILRANLSLPTSIDEDHTLVYTFSEALTHLGSRISLDGVAVPDDLQRVEVGAHYFTKLTEGRSWAIRAQGGFAGETNISSQSPMSYSVSGHYAFPSESNSEDTWAVTLFYGNAVSFGSNFPIPGILYFFKRDHFSGVLGFPLISLNWNFADGYFSSINIIGSQLNSEIAKGNPREIQYYSAFAWNQQTFVLQNRKEDQDRVTVDEKRLSLGARLPLYPFLRADLQSGVSFDRSVFAGQGSFNRDRGSVNLDRDYFVNASMRMFF